MIVWGNDRIARGFLVLALILGAAIFAASESFSQQGVTLTVSAAISVKNSLDEIGRAYEQEHPGVKIAFNYGGSGTLQHQIEQGAPVDIFFSAAERQMDKLQAEGLLAAGSRRNIVANTLVLIAPASSNTIHDFSDLTRPDARVIALGEASTVPAGMYARQTLERLGLFQVVRKKIVYAKDVRAVLTYVETGNADAGIVYQTDAKISSRVRIVATAPGNSHDPIVYPAALLKNSKNVVAAREFLSFLEGAGARTVFQKYGFTSPEK
ncbi:MAG: molybdate ABC transporter substrate-binding protein [Candidatus Acidiferrales bacterium]